MTKMYVGSLYGDYLINNLNKIFVERCSLLYCSTYRDDIFINDERLISVILDILPSNHLKMSISILTLFYLFQVLISADLNVRYDHYLVSANVLIFRKLDESS